MTKYRRAAKVDTNQPEIVKALRDYGCSVQVGHDDILVGYDNFTYWYEIKEQRHVSPKTGKVRESALKPSQKELLKTWKGHYRVVTSAQEILADIGICEGGYCEMCSEEIQKKCCV